MGFRFETFLIEFKLLMNLRGIICGIFYVVSCIETLQILVVATVGLFCYFIQHKLQINANAFDLTPKNLIIVLSVGWM